MLHSITVQTISRCIRWIIVLAILFAGAACKQSEVADEGNPGAKLLKDFRDVPRDKASAAKDRIEAGQAAAKEELNRGGSHDIDDEEENSDDEDED